MPLNRIVNQGGFFTADKGSWVCGNAWLDTTTSNITAGTLYSYLNSVQGYHCPNDRSTVRNHPELQKTRSYSVSVWLNGSAGPNVFPNDLDRDDPLPRKLSSLPSPGPARTFALIEVHENCIDDGSFRYPSPYARFGKAWAGGWDHIPAQRHNNGCNVTFADGHSEYWHWKWNRTVRRQDNPFGAGYNPTNPADRADLQRIYSATPGAP